MVDPQRATDSPTYEIRIRGDIPVALREQFPDMAVGCCPTETVLCRNVSGLGELDLLLEQLQSMGLVLTELHEVPSAAPASAGRADDG